MRNGFFVIPNFFTDNNEVEIVRVNGLQPIINGAAIAAENLTGYGTNKTDKELTQLEELATQCSRALRNLSVNRESLKYNGQLSLLFYSTAMNKSAITLLGAAKYLEHLANYPNDRISQQARRALRNLDPIGK